MVSPCLEDLDGEVRVPVDGPVQVWADGAIHWLGRETGDVGDDDDGDDDGGGDGDNFGFEYVHYPQHSDVGLGGKRLRNRSWSMSFHWRCPERGGVY